MIYLDWIKKNKLYNKWCEYRLHHLKISKNRALRAFCLRNGFDLAGYRRKSEKWLNDAIRVAKVNLYELR